MHIYAGRQRVEEEEEWEECRVVASLRTLEEACLQLHWQAANLQTLSLQKPFMEEKQTERHGGLRRSGSVWGQPVPVPVPGGPTACACMLPVRGEGGATTGEWTTLGMLGVETKN